MDTTISKEVFITTFMAWTCTCLVLTTNINSTGAMFIFIAFLAIRLSFINFKEGKKRDNG